MVGQGDIIRTDGIKFPLLVISKSAYNVSGMVMTCPIKLGEKIEDTLQKKISWKEKKADLEGTVCCGIVQTLDLSARRFSVSAQLPLVDQIDILDMVQSVIDYL